MTTTGTDLVAAERATHEARGYDAAHDDALPRGTLALAAVLIASPIAGIELGDWWNGDVEDPDHADVIARAVAKQYPNDPVHRLTIAGSLIAAEIDREIRRGA